MPAKPAKIEPVSQPAKVKISPIHRSAAPAPAAPLTGGAGILQRQAAHSGPLSEADKVIQSVGTGSRQP